MREQEEHPPIIQNFGMASSLVNYYRKKDEKDDHVPKVGSFFVRAFRSNAVNSMIWVYRSFWSLKTKPRS